MRRSIVWLLCAPMVMFGGARFGWAGPPSTSKLSIHLIMNCTSGASQIAAARPRLLKVLDLGPGMLQAMREYKASTPGGKVVLRIFTSRQYGLQDDPTASGNDFWTTVLAPPINALSPADRALIDYVEGPNEAGSTPTLFTVEEARWYNTFWLALAQRIADAGFRPCAYSIGVGNPDGTLADIHQKLDAIVPSLRKCRQLGGAWSYHAYTLGYTTNTDTEIWFTLRYRLFYEYFAQNYPDLTDLTMILSEGGVDLTGDAATSGWRARGTAGDYQNWLTWFDGQMQQDPYVLGCTLFEIGMPAWWWSFDLEPIAPWLANRLLAMAPPPTLVRSPASLSANAYVGMNPSSLPFTVTNSGTGTVNYAITDNVAWLSVSPGSGSTTGETDTLSIDFATAGLRPGMYSATITIADPAAANSPQTIAVSLLQQPAPIPGDMDADRDVDSTDVSLFLSCLAGAGVAPPANCGLADVDHDADVDLSDFGILQRCHTGTGITGNSNCGG